MSLPSCPTELWPEFSRLLDAALELPQAERADWLDRLPAEHAQVLPWLRRILVGSAQVTKDFLEAPQLHLVTLPDEFSPGTSIGPYALIGELGRGGMGTVYSAERIGGVAGLRVALKVIKRGLDTDEILRRFRREREILAALKHPNITHLIDGGVADSGQAWFAMELIDGVPLVHWCDSSRLSIAQRIELFLSVCAAVQHAHQNLVVHRDLKSSNILIDTQGQVKLLDFGIAKLLRGEQGDGEATRTQFKLLTPEFAAPEQLSDGPITTATDVYQLGLVMYELLSGHRALRDAHGQIGHLADAGLQAGVVRASEKDTAATRNVTPQALRKMLHGDLDRVVRKALSEEPARRYESVAAFADDLRRFLAGQPVRAVGDSRGYRIRKFLRRNRTSSALVAILLLGLLASTFFALYTAHSERTQRQRADVVKNFLLDIFNASDPRLPSDKPGGQITAKELLERSSQHIANEFADQPQTRIELLGVVAEIEHELGEDDRANALNASQTELARRDLGESSETYLAALLTAQDWACVANRWTQCIALLEQTDALLDRANSNQGVLRARWWLDRGLYLRVQSDGAANARTAFEAAIGLLQVAAPEDPLQVTALSELGTVASDQMDLLRAVHLYRQALALAERLPRRNTEELQTIYGNIGSAYMQMGRYAEAGEAMDKAVEISAKTSGSDSRATWQNRATAARMFHLAGERGRADAAFEKLMPLLPNVEALDSAATTAREYYGGALVAEGRPRLALPLLLDVERVWQQAPDNDYALRRARLRLADAFAGLGLVEKAREKYRQSLDDYLAHVPHDSQPMFAARERYGRFLLDLGEADAAREQFDAVVAQANDRLWSHIALAHGDLARVALLQKNRLQALAESEKALDLWQRKQGFYDIRMQPYLQRIRADVLVADGQWNEAQQLEDAAWQASQKYDAPESPTRQKRELKKH